MTRNLVRPNALVRKHPDAWTEGSLRWLLFRRRDELINAGVLMKHGRVLLIDEDRFFEFLADNSGRAA